MSPRSRTGELEQAVLEALWDLGSASGREVHERLSGRDLMRDALDVTGADRDQALVSFVGEASAEDVAALRRALAELA